jgi:hypothetical protein
MFGIEFPSVERCFQFIEKFLQIGLRKIVGA